MIEQNHALEKIMTSSTHLPFGVNDHSYKAAGELHGLQQLTRDFYHFMSTQRQAKSIRDMHPSDVSRSQEKLCFFLSGWLGGPKIYSKAFGAIHIPKAHQAFPISEEHAQAWLYCMDLAIDKQKDYSDPFKHYLKEQLRVPVQRILDAQ